MDAGEMTHERRTRRDGLMEIAMYGAWRSTAGMLLSDCLDSWKDHLCIVSLSIIRHY
jgi:hypothetical protein